MEGEQQPLMERLKMALQFTKCCYCVNLKTGSVLIAYFHLFSNLVTIQIFLLSWLLADWTAIISKKEGEFDTYTKTVIIVVIVTSIMYIPIAVICLLGLHRNISHYVSLYLLYTLIYIVVIIFLFIGGILTGHADFGFLMWDILSIGMCIYFYLVVRSYYLSATSGAAAAK
ncbi:uncharacterized protein LOC111356749 [Spodoptera litura]|uniref:Uncharacterized protein LOC111356749 n=1 Tax=Spodoptera litura TaxID=69820 RepID=A0A9J7EE84_SPOLT|nr:uncharacterized protein LOC111356749 [Spodoptera litura]